MKRYRKILIAVCLSLGCLLAANALAALVPCGEAGNPCKLCHLWLLFDNIIHFLVIDLSLPLAAFLFVISGVVLMSAGGNTKRVELSKKIFVNTLIGLVIIFCAWLIVDTIIKTVAGGSFITAWNVFPACP